MNDLSKVPRIAFLAVLAGSLIVRTGSAAEPARLCPDYAAAFAQAYASSYCSGMGHSQSSVSYACNEDGTITIVRVVCWE